MTRFTASLCLTATALAVAACASQPPVAADDWNRPFKEATVKPVLMHDMAIANPPHPQPHYVDYMDEPSRFIFRPREVPVEATDDGSGDAMPDEGGGDLGGGYLENGILYVDPNG